MNIIAFERVQEQGAAFCDKTQEAFQGCQGDEEVELRNKVVKISEKLEGKQKLIVKEKILSIFSFIRPQDCSVDYVDRFSHIFTFGVENALQEDEKLFPIGSRRMTWKKPLSLKSSITFCEKAACAPCTNLAIVHY